MSFTGSHDSNEDSSSGGSSVDTAATSSQMRGPINIELDLPTSVHADTESDVVAAHVMERQPIETSSDVYSLRTDDMMAFHPALGERNVSPADPSPAPGAHFTSGDRTQAQAQVPRPDHQAQVPRPAHQAQAPRPARDRGRSAPRVSSQSDTPAVMISRRAQLAAHPGREPWEIVVALVRAYLSAQEPAAVRGRGVHRKAMSAGDVDLSRARWGGVGTSVGAGKAASTGSAADASSIDIPPPIALMNEHMSDQGKSLDRIQSEMAEHTKETRKQTQELEAQTKAMHRQELATAAQTEAIRKNTESIQLLGDKFTRSFDILSDKVTDSIGTVSDKNVRGFENVVHGLQDMSSSMESSFDRSLMKAVKHLEDYNKQSIREAIREGLQEIALSRARE